MKKTGVSSQGSGVSKNRAPKLTEAGRQFMEKESYPGAELDSICGSLNVIQTALDNVWEEIDILRKKMKVQQ